jgi:hypothetical protein
MDTNANNVPQQASREALAAGIPVYLIEDDQAIPNRVLAEDGGLA